VRFKAKFIRRDGKTYDSMHFIMALLGQEGTLIIDKDFAYFGIGYGKYENFRTSLLQGEPVIEGNKVTFKTMNSLYEFEIVKRLEAVGA
jgi:hypothetical protein